MINPNATEAIERIFASMARVVEARAPDPNPDVRGMEGSLYTFLKNAWHVLEYSPFIEAPHVEIMCQHLEALARGDIKRLLICVPPGFAKSLTCAVMFFCWVWTREPWTRWLWTSYAEEHALRDSEKCRQLIKSPWYQSRWGSAFYLRKTADTKGNFISNRGGFRLATSVEGRGTGVRADYVCTDDPLKIEHAHSKIELERVARWWDKMMEGRCADPRASRFLAVAQRLDPHDLPGVLARRNGWVHLFIPMEFNPKRRCETPFYSDPRQEPGQLIWPEVWDREKVDSRKAVLGPLDTACQLNQDPESAGDDNTRLFANFLRFTVSVERRESVHPITKQIEETEVEVVTLRSPDGERKYDVDRLYFFQTVDTALKTGQENDFTCVVSFALTPDCDLLVWHVLRDKVIVPRQYEYVLDAARHCRRQPSLVGIEDKASGTGILQEGRIRGRPFMALKADTDKIRRASEAATMYRLGKVFHREGEAWLGCLEDELFSFPHSNHDDQVDCVAHAARLARYEALILSWLKNPLIAYPEELSDQDIPGTVTIGDVKVNLDDDETDDWFLR